MADAGPPKRPRITDGSASVAYEVIEELKAGALCMKCVATRRRLILGVVQETVARLRGAFLLDPTSPCLACGRRPAITRPGALARPAAGSSGPPSTSPRRSRPRPFECAIAAHDGAAEPFGLTHAHAPAADDDDGRRVVATLETLRPDACCAGCLALAAELSLEAARRTITALSRRAAVSVDLDGTCSVCGLGEAVITA
jgi:hypothetical protein